MGALISTASACSASRTERGSDGPISLLGAGPWADEFATAISDASDHELAILEDGVVTPKELADAQAKMRECMAEAGYGYRELDDGTAEIQPLDGDEVGQSDAALATKQRCATRFDRSITYLFNEVRRNPEKQDDAEITVACLKKAGLVTKAYSEREWRDEDDKGVYSYDQWAPEAVQCRLDPLGLWRHG
ncbi:hypothetical protein [Curtobacterium sp. MCSS17_015]|uniref:hypothetical protein n=1 Tax=Curtobacterium sp. MCSS17_015 TaxID=2175666 RepID=UPI0011B4240B|nr:hypothetical protein [Curtobacterium sp. MCSS17_015]WIB27060.1 hypothetical protein DEJ18_02905 [Curtobacterium sp. MCSS17_015]